MTDQKLDTAIRKIYADEGLTRNFADDPKGTLENLGVDVSKVTIGDPIIPSEEEAAQVCVSVCPGIPIINACIGASVGEEIK